MKDLIYPAIFRKEENGAYSVFFPDLDNGATFGNDLADALYMAKDYVGAFACFCEEDKRELPKATPIKEVKLEQDGDFLSLISVNFSEYKKSIQKSVKKTVYLPKDLNDEAEEFDINFSKVLRDALKIELEKVRVSK